MEEEIKKRDERDQEREKKINQMEEQNKSLLVRI